MSEQVPCLIGPPTPDAAPPFAIAKARYRQNLRDHVKICPVRVSLEVIAMLIDRGF
jgi:hypothetical protein